MKLTIAHMAVPRVVFWPKINESTLRFQNCFTGSMIRFRPNESHQAGSSYLLTGRVPFMEPGDTVPLGARSPSVQGKDIGYAKEVLGGSF